MNEKALLHITSATPRPGALERVLAAVYARQQRSRLWRVRVFVVTAALSAVALVPVVISLVSAFAASDFATYLSLAFTDGSVGVWLVESLPAVSLMLTLALVGTFLWSLRGAVQFAGNKRLINA